MPGTIRLPNIQDFSTRNVSLVQCLTCHLFGKGIVSGDEQQAYQFGREHLTEFPEHQILLSYATQMTKKP